MGFVAQLCRSSGTDVVGLGKTDRLVDPNDVDSGVLFRDLGQLLLACICSNDYFHFNITACEETAQTGVEQTPPLVVHDDRTDSLQTASLRRDSNPSCLGQPACQ